MSEDAGFRKCDKHGVLLECIGGCSAHWDNWYCPVCLCDAQKEDLKKSRKTDEVFGDTETLLNSRDWLQSALEAKGAKVTGAGCGCGAADLWIELDGREVFVTIKPVMRGL